MRNLKFKRQHTDRDRQETSEPPPLLRNDIECIGAHAEYRRDDYIFPRMQSVAMRELEWESRLEPIKPWGVNVVADLAWHIFA